LTIELPRSPIPYATKEKNREISNVVVDSLKECDIQLQAMARCDDRIAKFEELLAQMRTDLYGSIEALSSKIESTAAATAPIKRGVPRIISDVQLVPPRINTTREDEMDESEAISDQEDWPPIAGRSRSKSKVKIPTPAKHSRKAGGGKSKISSGEENARQRSSLYSGSTPRRRPPKNAAVTIRTNPDGPFYAEIIKQARERVNFKELGITNPRMRRAANGGILIEILGSEETAKADALASRLRESHRTKCGSSSPCCHGGH